jgi:hypothetical protein
VDIPFARVETARRHTLASILLMSGESPAYVKEQLATVRSRSPSTCTATSFLVRIARPSIKLPSLTSPKAASKAAGD